MKEVLILDGCELLKKALLKVQLSQGLVMVDGNSKQYEPLTRGEVNALARSAKQRAIPNDFLNSVDNSWRGGSRKKGGKIGYRRG